MVLPLGKYVLPPEMILIERIKIWQISHFSRVHSLWIWLWGDPNTKHQQAFGRLGTIHKTKRLTSFSSRSSKSALKINHAYPGKHRKVPFFEATVAVFRGDFRVLGGGFKYFLFSSLYLGKIPSLTHIFQRGWLETTNQGIFHSHIPPFGGLLDHQACFDRCGTLRRRQQREPHE